MTFSTTTNGIDFVITAPIPNGTLIAVYNFTNTTVTDHNPDTLNEDRIRELQENLPEHRGSLTVGQSITDAWGVLGRASYFSGWFDSEDYLQNPDVPGTGEYTGRVILDLETTYNVGSGLALTFGGRNILNVYPDEIRMVLILSATNTVSTVRSVLMGRSGTLKSDTVFRNYNDLC